MTSAFSWQNSISLCPASFYTPRPNLSVTPGISKLPTFAFQYPIMNAKVGSLEVPGVTGKFGLGVQNEAGQRLTEFCQENTLLIVNTLF